MRRTAAVLAAVGIFLATPACGDDDSDDGGSAAAGGGFCDGLEGVYDDMGAGADTEVSEEQGREALDRLTELDPPDEIADDWQTFVDYLESAAGGAEPDQEAVDDWIAATQRLNAYAEEECGITPPAG
jgi:hypothetical protein